jgi:Ca2+-binding RTX toxin-like protein
MSFVPSTGLPTPPTTDYGQTLINSDDFDVTTDGDPTKSYTITGNDDNNKITGGDKADVIDAGLGFNTISSGKGNDWIISNDSTSSSNTIDGGDGKHDTIDYRNAHSAVTLDLTPDSGPANPFNGYGFAKFVDPVTGYEHLDHIKNVEDVVGTAFDDNIHGDNNDNTLYGGNGNDTLTGGGGNDTLIGGNGADTLLPGYGGHDVVNGGGGGDLFDTNNTVSYADDVNILGQGVTLVLADGVGTGGWANGTTYTNIQNVTGSQYNDNIGGDSNANVLDGGDGDDTLKGRGGADTFIGGKGNDTVSFEDAKDDVTANLSTGTGTAGDGSQVTFKEVENLTGSDHNDTFTGGGGHNVLDGGKGNDVLDGKGGDDTLIGGLGADTLTGGKGADTFVYQTVADSAASGLKYDVITDFEAGTQSAPVDTINLHEIAMASGISQFTYVANPSTQPLFAGEVTTTAGSDPTTGAAATFVDVYTNSGGPASMVIELMGNIDLHQSNFIS